MTTYQLYGIGNRGRGFFETSGKHWDKGLVADLSREATNPCMTANFLTFKEFPHPFAIQYRTAWPRNGQQVK